VAQLVPAVRPAPSKPAAQAPAEEEALDVEQLLQELDETAAQREVEQQGRARRAASRRAQRRWRFLRANLKRLGIEREDTSSRFARITRERLAMLQRFRAENPDYPFGPMPEPLLSRQGPRSSSPRRLAAADKVEPRPSTVLGGGRSDARVAVRAKPTLVEPPDAFDAAPTLRSSVSAIQLPPLDKADQYGVAAGKRSQLRQRTTPRGQASLAWTSASEAAPGAADSAGSTPDSIIDAGSQPSSARAAALRAARGAAPREPPLGNGSPPPRLRPSPSAPHLQPSLQRLPDEPTCRSAWGSSDSSVPIPRRTLVGRGRPHLDLANRGRQSRFETLPPENLVPPPRVRNRERWAMELDPFRPLHDPFESEPPPPVAPMLRPSSTVVDLRQSHRAALDDLQRALRPSTSEVALQVRPREQPAWDSSSAVPLASIVEPPWLLADAPTTTPDPYEIVPRPVRAEASPRRGDESGRGRPAPYVPVPTPFRSDVSPRRPDATPSPYVPLPRSSSVGDTRPTTTTAFGLMPFLSSTELERPSTTEYDYGATLAQRRKSSTRSSDKPADAKDDLAKGNAKGKTDKKGLRYYVGL